MRTVLALAALMLGVWVVALPEAASAAEPRTTAEIVRHMADRRAILELMGQYGLALDSADGEGYAGLFTDDAVIIAGDGTEYRGHAALAKMAGTPGLRPTAPDAPRPANPVVRHPFSNVTMQIDGDRARVRAYWTVVDGTSGAPVLRASGRYDDRLVKQGGRWRFTQRRIINEMSIFPMTRPPLPKD